MLEIVRPQNVPAAWRLKPERKSEEVVNRGPRVNYSSFYNVLRESATATGHAAWGEEVCQLRVLFPNDRASFTLRALHQNLIDELPDAGTVIRESHASIP